MNWYPGCKNRNTKSRGSGALSKVHGEWLTLEQVAKKAQTSMNATRKAMLYGAISAEKFIEMRLAAKYDVKKMALVNKFTGNCLAEFEIYVDKKLSTEDQEIEVNKFLDNCVEWREDDATD